MAAHDPMNQRDAQLEGGSYEDEEKLGYVESVDEPPYNMEESV